MIYKISEIKKIHPHFEKEIQEIFYLTSEKKEFKNSSEKVKFYNTWCGYYIKNHPQNCLLYLENKKVVAYILCMTNSNAMPERYFNNVPSFNLFKNLFKEYPAHLHMNTHPNSQGMGLGSKLINELCKKLESSNIIGLHLITSPTSNNVKFYDKNGFSLQIEKKYKSTSFLFMGKKLKLK